MNTTLLNKLNKTIERNEAILAFAEKQDPAKKASIKKLRKELGFSFLSRKQPFCKQFLDKYECTCDGYMRICPFYNSYLVECSIDDLSCYVLTWKELIKSQKDFLSKLNSLKAGFLNGTKELVLNDSKEFIHNRNILLKGLKIPNKNE